MNAASFLALAVSSMLPLAAQAQDQANAKPAPVVISDAAWTHGLERGLPVHDLEGAGASAQLVCDPDRVFGPRSNGSFAVTLPAERQPARVVILAATGEQAAFELEEGRIAQSKADPEEWLTLVAILGSNTRFAVVSAHDAVTWTVAEVLSGPCD
jgi:hypothetical protein